MQNKQELNNFYQQEKDLLKSENNMLRQEINRLSAFLKNSKQISVPYDDTQILLDQTLVQRLHINFLEKECAGLEEQYEDLLETYQKDVQKIHSNQSQAKESSYLENTLETIQKKNQQLEKQLSDLSKEHAQKLNTMKMKFYEQQAFIVNNKEEKNNLAQSYNQKQALKLLQTPKRQIETDISSLKQTQPINVHQSLTSFKPLPSKSASRVLIKEQNLGNSSSQLPESINRISKKFSQSTGFENENNSKQLNQQ